MSTQSKKSAYSTVLAFAIAVAGLATASLGAAYIAGVFGLSVAFASQIVSAVSVGGWVLAVVMAGMSGGLAAVVIATTRWAITRWGKTIAAA